MPARSHLVFRKSSYSSGQGQNCVEVADLGSGTAIRDSKHPGEGHLSFPAVEWAALISIAQHDR